MLPYNFPFASTYKRWEKNGFPCARYPKWSKIYYFDPLPVLLAIVGELFLVVVVAVVVAPYFFVQMKNGITF